MKKSLLLSVLCVAALQANAENRSWDFTNWSDETVNNLIDGDDWSDIEKSDDTAPTDLSKDKCFWEVSASGSTSEQVTLTANGVTIAELEGLYYTNTTDRSLAIAVDYQNADEDDEAFQGYNGPSYLWMGSSKKQYFVIPGVKPGATITIGVESHKNTSARGIYLYLGWGTSGTQLLSPDGTDVEVPTKYEEQTWYVPEDADDTPNDDGTYDIQIYNTNGCHMYFIEVNEDLPSVSDANLAYVYNSSVMPLDDDAFYDILANNESFDNVTVETIDATGDVSAYDADSLKGYDVVVMAPSLDGSEDIVSTLKEDIAYVPMLNLNPNLYDVWGYGTATETSTNYITVPEAYWEHNLFLASTQSDNYINDDGTLQLFEDGVVTAVTIPDDSYFSDDKILATADDAVAVHLHSPASRNSYMLLSYGLSNMNYTTSVIDLVTNAIQVVNATKSDITQASTPVMTESYKQLNTDVTISSSTDGAVIYYTLDGSEPSDASTLYSEAINITESETNLKAIAYADGYYASDILDTTIYVYETTDVPEFSVSQEDGAAVVTLTTTTEGATIYYNITGSDDESESEAYSEPIEITSYTTITAFTAAYGDYIQSETVSQAVYPESKEVRIDEVSHFDANATDWSGGESKTKYYTDGNKSGYDYYTTEEQTVTASDGSDSTVTVITGTADVLTVWNPGNGWEAKSYGQGMLWERISVDDDIDNSNTTSRYRGETALDCGASDNCVTFGNVQKSDGENNDPYSCSIQSTEAFQGPFDIEVFVGNSSSSNTPRALICVSTDTLDEANWVDLDSLSFSSKQRYIKRTVLSYEGTDEVYVKLQADFSSVMVFDIIILNHGDESEEATGIVDITTGDATTGEAVSTYIYNINGAQLNTMTKGINIIKEVYSNGEVRARKVIVK